MTFYKYQGTGNDFILIDNRDGLLQLDKDKIASLCDRRFGIGADGLMLLENADGFDFQMVYYNADGNESTMCGNGGRCITAFANRLGIIDRTARFVAIDGSHTSAILNETVTLQMSDVNDIKSGERYAVLNTGSPHYVLWVDDVVSVPVFLEGRRIRNLPQFQPGGINVNFVQMAGGDLSVRTYERGVEDETLSCGTGVTAAAIAAAGSQTGTFVSNIITPGGRLRVAFTKTTPATAIDVTLSGPAVFVFKGEIN